MGHSRDLVEIFGFAADDTTEFARTLWQLGACPFTGRGCIKFNHDKSITYGTCSATSPYGDLVICPNRLYANNYEIIRRVAEDAFGAAIPFYMFDEQYEYVIHAENPTSVHIINQNALVHDVVLVLGAVEGVEPAPRQLPGSVARADSYTFCDQCGAALGFLLDQSWPEEKIRKVWSDLLS